MEVIPAEILLIVFDLLSTEDKIRLSCVCNRLRSFYSSTSLIHRKVSFRHSWCVPGGAICKYISQNSKFIHHLNIQDCYWIKQPELVNCLKKCTQLISLNVQGCNLSVGNICVLGKKFPNLQHAGYQLTINSDFKMSEFFHKGIKGLSSLDVIINKSDYAIPDVHNLAIILREVSLKDKGSLTLKTIKFIGENYCEEKEYAFCFSQPLLQARKSNENTTKCHLQNCTVLKMSTRIIMKNILDLHEQNCNGDDICTESIKCVAFADQCIMSNDYAIVEKFLKYPSLEHISLANMSIEENLIKTHPMCHFVSCISSCILETIDLEGCKLEKLDFLDKLIERCRSSLKYANLLLSGRHHGRSDNNMTEQLAKCEKLQSIALSPCCLKGSGSNEDHEPLSSNPLLMLVQSTRFLTEFKLIGTGGNERDVSPILSEHLASISQWKYLKKLTLAGFQISGCSEFFITICQNCTELRSLSLANLKGPALVHSGNVAHFNTALGYCKNLRDFRLEQPYFSISKAFLQALHNANQLERVIWKVRSGTLAKEHLGPWMNKCTKVICVLICCDVSKKAGKTLQKHLIDKYRSRRPAIVIAVLPFISQNCHPIRDLAEPSNRSRFPLVHLQDMAFLSTKIEKAWRNSLLNW